MNFRINHIHIKSNDPEAAANWFRDMFRLTFLSDAVRPVGDRFIRYHTEDGALGVNFSGPRTGEVLAEAQTGVRQGLEHFGIDSADIEADIRRLTAAGAVLEEPISAGRGGQLTAFLGTPFGVRIELIQPASQTTGG